MQTPSAGADATVIAQTSKLRRGRAALSVEVPEEAVPVDSILQGNIQAHQTSLLLLQRRCRMAGKSSSSSCSLVVQTDSRSLEPCSEWGYWEGVKHSSASGEEYLGEREDFLHDDDGSSSSSSRSDMWQLSPATTMASIPSLSPSSSLGDDMLCYNPGNDEADQTMQAVLSGMEDMLLSPLPNRKRKRDSFADGGASAEPKEKKRRRWQNWTCMLQ